MITRTFRAIFTPDEDGWNVRLPDVQGCHSWGSTINEARKNIREALSTCDDIFGQWTEEIAENALFLEEFVSDGIEMP